MVSGVGEEVQLDVFSHGQLFPERVSNFGNVANVIHIGYFITQ